MGGVGVELSVWLCLLNPAVLKRAVKSCCVWSPHHHSYCHLLDHRVKSCIVQSREEPHKSTNTWIWVATLKYMERVKPKPVPAWCQRTTFVAQTRTFCWPILLLELNITHGQHVAKNKNGSFLFFCVCQCDFFYFKVGKLDIRLKMQRRAPLEPGSSRIYWQSYIQASTGTVEMM